MLGINKTAITKIQAILVAAVVIIAAIGAVGYYYLTLPEPPAELTDFTVHLDWIIYGKHAPYIVAQKNGYYADEGLNPTIERGYGSVECVKTVNLGNALFGLADMTAMVRSVDQGATTVAVAIIGARCAGAVAFLEGSGISTPKDLEGKTGGATLETGTYAVFPAFCEANGVDADTIKFVNIASGTEATVVVTKQVDFSLVSKQTYMVLQKNAESIGLVSDSFDYEDYGVNTYEHALIIKRENLEKYPETVRRFLRATLKGYQWSLEHPEEAINMIYDDHPEVGYETLRDGFYIGCTMMIADQYTFEKNRIGWMEPSKVQDAIDLINEYIEEVDVKPEDIFTNNEYLPNIPLPTGWEPPTKVPPQP